MSFVPLPESKALWLAELLQTKKILVVDDEPDILEVVCELLQGYGCQTFKASDGHQALKLLESEQVDVIISDVRMPVLDGLTLLKVLEERHSNTRPPVILVTASTDIPAEEAVRQGAAFFLLKPLRFERLLDVLCECLESDAQRARS